MGGLVPLGDASRPHASATVTVLIILVNAYVFLQELVGGNRFVHAWSAIPIRITHGHHSITLLTSMFMHASWMHIIGNMIFLWRRCWPVRIPTFHAWAQAAQSRR